MHRRAGRSVAATAALVAICGASLGSRPAPAWADPRSAHEARYSAPSDAPVVDAFRAPAEPWSAGNRGIDFATARGDVVRAAASGEVVFAGPVAGASHVVLLHPDGLRTSYSFLASVSVRRGDRLRQGDEVGVAAGALHFGVRAGDKYLDPATVLAGPAQVHLVPDESRRPGSVAVERSALARFLGGVRQQAAAAGSAAWRWARTEADVNLAELRGAAHYAWQLTPVAPGLRLVAGIRRWQREQRQCTPAAVAPPRLAERHLLVLVAGLGSSSTEGAIDDVDTTALGYAADDVVRFSYAGGTTAENVYGPADTTVDLRISARRLRELLARLAAENPGVPIDLVAHSQGGVVSHAALTDEFDGLDTRLPPIGALVTLGSPHRGADLATAVFMIGRSDTGLAAERILATVLDNGVDPASPAVSQLAETSSFIRALRDRPLPAGLSVTTISARGDLVVTAGRSTLSGARRSTVALPGLLDDHGDLPGSAAAHREIALGLAGLGPTCETLSDAITDLAVSDAVGRAEDVTGLGLSVGARRLDGKYSAKGPPRRMDGPGAVGRRVPVPIGTRKEAP